MFLLRCPQCRGCFRVEDDAEKGRCPKCRMWVGAVERHVVRDPAEVREYVLKWLKPIADLMRPFGISQTCLAVGAFVPLFASGEIRVELLGTAESLALVAVVSVVLVSGVLIVAGGVAVHRGRGWLLAVVGAWLALTSPLLVGLPFAVLALIRLTRPEVKAAFGRV